MIKKIVIVLLIAVLAAGAAFGADKEGFIKPYFGIGGAGTTFKADFAVPGLSFSDKVLEGSGFALITGVDYINPIGITLGFKYTMLPAYKVKTYDVGAKKWDKEKETNQDTLAAGLGYTFSADKFCVGGKLLFAIMSDQDTGFQGKKANLGLTVGGAVDFTFWVIESLGISALFDIYFPGKTNDIEYAVDKSTRFKLNGTTVVFGVGASLKL